jgi:hypothetical protein
MDSPFDGLRSRYAVRSNQRLECPLSGTPFVGTTGETLISDAATPIWNGHCRQHCSLRTSNRITKHIRSPEVSTSVSWGDISHVSHLPENTV